MWRQSYRCYQIDGKRGAISGHSRDPQNPVDSTKLKADIPAPLLPQDEPS
jgi:hypothetical protein